MIGLWQRLCTESIRFNLNSICVQAENVNFQIVSSAGKDIFRMRIIKWAAQVALKKRQSAAAFTGSENLNWKK